MSDTECFSLVRSDKEEPGEVSGLEGGVRERNTFKERKRCTKARVERPKLASSTRTSCLGPGFSLRISNVVLLHCLHPRN